MPLASSRHHLPFWFRVPGAGGRPPRMNVSETRRSQTPHESRSLVPRREKLLLIAVLLIAVAWIGFRVAMLLNGAG